MKKYRLGKRQKRAILEVATGHEYLVFPQSKTEHVAEFLEWLNGREQYPSLTETKAFTSLSSVGFDAPQAAVTPALPLTTEDFNRRNEAALKRLAEIREEERKECPDCQMGRDPFEPDWTCPECRRKRQRTANSGLPKL